MLESVGPLGIAVRAGPSRESAKVNIEMPGTLLVVSEPASTGLPKIGVEGEWLAIKASNNQNAYVAAQCVQLKP